VSEGSKTLVTLTQQSVGLERMQIKLLDISLQTAAGGKKKVNFAGEKVFEFPSSSLSEFYSIC